MDVEVRILSPALTRDLQHAAVSPFFVAGCSPQVNSCPSAATVSSHYTKTGPQLDLTSSRDNLAGCCFGARECWAIQPPITPLKGYSHAYDSGLADQNSLVNTPFQVNRTFRHGVRSGQLSNRLKHHNLNRLILRQSVPILCGFHCSLATSLADEIKRLRWHNLESSKRYVSRPFEFGGVF